VPEAERNRALVSCVVPVYNGERHIESAIQGILDQTYRPIEILVVDDGSVDGTRGRLAAFGDRIRVLGQEQSGPAVARNHGARESRGELVAFHDADDLWHPEKLARQVARFEARPELASSITLVENFWDAGQEPLERHYGDHPRMRPVPGYAGMTLVVRRAVFDEVGGFDGRRRHTDVADFFLRLRERGLETELVPEVLAYRRLHSRSLTRVESQEGEDEFLSLVKASLDRRRDRARP
jgi:glycosyltransferase involved in cell wall biosynthesis